MSLELSMVQTTLYRCQATVSLSIQHRITSFEYFSFHFLILCVKSPFLMIVRFFRKPIASNRPMKSKQTSFDYSFRSQSSYQPCRNEGDMPDFPCLHQNMPFCSIIQATALFILGLYYHQKFQEDLKNKNHLS